MMRKLFWVILGILLSPVLLFVVLGILLYLPPVQNWMVDKVASVSSEKTGMQISVGHVSLAFPLDLSVEDILVIAPPSTLLPQPSTLNPQSSTIPPDTIADIQRVVVDVSLQPLFSGRVVVNELGISKANINTNGFIEAARVKGRVGSLRVRSDGIDLKHQTVEVNRTLLEDAHLDIALNDSVPEDTTKSETLWKIHVDELSVLRSAIAVHLAGDTTHVAAQIGSFDVDDALIDLATQTYTVKHLQWIQGSAFYASGPREKADTLALRDFQINTDDIYFHDPLLRVPKFRFQTADSDVDLSLELPLTVADSINPGSMNARLKAQLGRQTLQPLMSTLPKEMVQRWPDQALLLNGTATGNLQRLELSDLNVKLPTAFLLQADGYVGSLDHPEKLQADIQFKAETQHMDFVAAVLGNGYRLPPMTANGRLQASGQHYTADLTAREGRGVVAVNAQYDGGALRYDATMKVSDLDLRHFMPRDSLRTLQADITVKGQGTDFLSPRTTLNAHADIHHLGYGRWNLDQVKADAEVKNGHALVGIDSRNPLATGKVSVDALLNPKKLVANVSAELQQVDLYKLGVMDRPLTVGLCGQIDLTSDMKLTHTVSGLVSDIYVRDSSRTATTEFLGLHVRTAPDTTLVRVQSGDFIVKLDGSGNYEQLLKQCTMLGDTLAGQFSRKIIDQPALMRLLPSMSLHVESKRDNPIATLLKTSQQIDFKELLFDMTSSPTTGLNGQGYLHALTLGDVRLDTINFRLTQRQNRLSFGGQIRNNKKNPQFVFNTLFDGVFQERGATMGVRYYDASDKLGIRLGVQAELGDSGINLHLVPSRPTLGYKEYALNADNYIFLGADKKVRAKIDLLADDGMGMMIYSEENDPTALQDITVSLQRFNLDEITSVIPYAPRMSGFLSGDFHVIQDAREQISVVSDLAVQDMTYEKSPIGNVSTELVYLQREDDAHAVEARLMKDDVEIGLLTGTYYNKGGGTLDAKLQLERMPLSLANGFITDQLFGLYGFGDGELTVKGSLSNPKVDGEVYLDSSYVESIPYGVRLRFDNDPVRIVNSSLLLDNFTVYSHNENPLNIQGSVNFGNMERVMVDVRMRARDFQIIGMKENTKSVAYGKAFVDIFAIAKGPLDNLSLRGRLNVLGSTDMGYILRDSPITTDNQLDNLVKFTDFADTTKIVVQRPSLNGLRMEMTLDVSKGAHIIAYLNADHSNYIDLLGGGTLRMQYNPSDNLRLTGRYTLSNGEMKYALPIIPLKTFTIRDGSYIEFTGEPMNPTLNITATERTRATVTGSNGVGRSVDFDCGVIITRTLNDMGLEFTLDAPEDNQLHSELQTMGVDQRGKLAVTMLTTGMYLADGNTNAFSMNSALSSFLSSEISNLTGNALRTLDLSFGMDNSTDATGNSHTDYSFKFAKRFLNNRLKVAVGGKVTSGAEMPNRNKSFFDNVSLEYRLDDTANKYLSLYYQNNSYDWLDGYTQKYGGGFIWRRTLQKFTDIFRFKEVKQPVRKTSHETK